MHARLKACACVPNKQTHISHIHYPNKSPFSLFFSKLEKLSCNATANANATATATVTANATSTATSTAAATAAANETATATAIGWGYRNTRAIILAGNTDTGTASALADSYAVTVGGVVVDDWYLPSLDELNEMYIRKTNIGGFDESDLYWSSTDSTSTNARRQRFNNTGENWTGSGKFATNKVRPIRAF